MTDSPELAKDLEEGKVVLGGCVVTDDSPQWRCLSCGVKIYKIAAKKPRSSKPGRITNYEEVKY